MLNPTVATGLTAELDVPKAVKQAAGSNVSFSNPAVHKPYIEAVGELAKLKPPYLALATDINLLALAGIKLKLFGG